MASRLKTSSTVARALNRRLLEAITPEVSVCGGANSAKDHDSSPKLSETRLPLNPIASVGTRRSGLTLLELLVAVAVGGMLVASLALAFSTSVRSLLRAPDALDRVERDRALEKRLTALISRAWVSTDQEDQTTYFIAGNSDESGLGSSESASEVTFTVLGEAVTAPAMSAQDLTFEERNERFGPIGGVTEVRLGAEPIGDPGDLVGLFLRRQTPSDEDPLQGGEEELLDSRVSNLTFEFWDGQEWIGQWDTTSDERRIPAAVRVSYSLTTDEVESRRVLVVRPINSDISSAVPLGFGGNSAQGGG